MATVPRRVTKGATVGMSQRGKEKETKRGGEMCGSRVCGMHMLSVRGAWVIMGPQPPPGADGHSATLKKERKEMGLMKEVWDGSWNAERGR